jgi:hypothetical protein
MQQVAMKFLCLAYEEEAAFAEMSRSDWAALRGETLAYVDALRKSGHLIATEPLQSSRTSATVRVRNGAASVLDGPYPDTKEQLGGYFVIEARDLREAVELASRWPSARLGSIVVRPIEDGLPEERRYR